MLNDAKAELLRRTTFTFGRGPEILLRRCSSYYNTKFVEVHWDIPVPVDSRERNPSFHVVCPECYQVYGKRTPFIITHL